MQKGNRVHSLIKNEYGFFQISPSPTYEEVDKFYREDFYADGYKYFNDSSIDVQNDDLEYNKKLWETDHKALTKAFEMYSSISREEYNKNIQTQG